MPAGPNTCMVALSTYQVLLNMLVKAAKSHPSEDEFVLADAAKCTHIYTNADGLRNSMKDAISAKV